MWRSPDFKDRRCERPSVKHPSFSRDQSLGALASFVALKSTIRAAAWDTYLGTLDSGRFLCPDDNSFTGDYCNMGAYKFPNGWSSEYYGLFYDVWRFLGLTPYSLWKKQAQQSWPPAPPIRENHADSDRKESACNTSINEEDFHLHNVGVQYFVEQLVGQHGTLDAQGVDCLVARSPGNAFYRFLKEGATDEVALLTIEKCASRINPPTDDAGWWIWMRSKNNEDQDIGWGCIFMINLLLGPETDLPATGPCDGAFVDDSSDVQHCPRFAGNFGYAAAEFARGRGLSPKHADLLGISTRGPLVTTNVLGAFESSASAWTAHPLSIDFRTEPVATGDVNGDGYDDIVFFKHNGVYLSLSTGKTLLDPVLVLQEFGSDPAAGGWNPVNHPRMLGDVDGDGRADIIGFSCCSVEVSFSTGAGFTSRHTKVPDFSYLTGYQTQTMEPRRIADIDGDGRSDIIGFNSNGVRIAVSRITSSTRSTANFQSLGGWVSFRSIAGPNPESGWTDDRRWPRLVGDVTGDGLADIVGFGDGGPWIARGLGNGVFAASTQPFPGVFSGYPGRFPRTLADVNGDGRLDLVAFANDGVHVAYSLMRNGQYAISYFPDPKFPGFGFDLSSGRWW